MHEGERSLAISLNANASASALQSIYSAVNAEVTIHLQGDGRTLALDWNGHYNAQLQLDQPLIPGLTCIANAQTGSITILGASASSSTIYRILVKQELEQQQQQQQSEDGGHQHDIHSQQVSSQYSNRRLVASHGLSSGTSDVGEASAAAAPALILAYADGSLVKIEWSEQEGRAFCYINDPACIQRGEADCGPSTSTRPILRIRDAQGAIHPLVGPFLLASTETDSQRIIARCNSASISCQCYWSAGLVTRSRHRSRIKCSMCPRHAFYRVSRSQITTLVHCYQYVCRNNPAS